MPFVRESANFIIRNFLNQPVDIDVTVLVLLVIAYLGISLPSNSEEKITIS